MIAELAKDIRQKERYYAGRYAFPDGCLTYWDADDFLLQCKMENMPSIGGTTDSGVKIQIYGEQLLDGYLAISPHRIIEAQFVPKEHLNQLLYTAETFGGGNVLQMEFPGRKEMATYCKGVDERAVELIRAYARKNEKAKGVIQSLYEEMGGDRMSGSRLVRRIGYMAKLIKEVKRIPSLKDDLRRLDLASK